MTIKPSPQSLFPCLEVNQSVDILEQVVTNTPITFEGVDWQEATKLLAVTTTKEEQKAKKVAKAEKSKAW